MGALGTHELIGITSELNFQKVGMQLFGGNLNSEEMIVWNSDGNTYPSRASGQCIWKRKFWWKRYVNPF